ncbi:hypothetical protein PVT71_12340 [Salipiger sp. H15]|uniref:Uncharacterized protein n=1 Tax=Alloyangia sp. H15 TaxID=3029062 RepID=A0AAU8AFJ0_9RHOB
MFAIALRPPELTVGGAVVRVSRRVVSELASAAADEARSKLADLRNCKPGDIPQHLEHLAEMQRQVISAAEQSAEIVRELRAAVALLTADEAPRQVTPLLHSAMQAHASFAAIRAAVRDADFAEIEAAVEQLNATADALEQDVETAKDRAEKLARLIEEANATGLSRCAVKARATVAAYPLPGDLADLAEAQPLAGKAAAAAAWIADKTASREQQKIERRDRQRQELKTNIAEVWR